MKYVSIDIETTGVDSQVDKILEIGVVVDDLRLDWDARQELQVTICEDPDELDILMSPYVRNMHTESGLLDDLGRTSDDTSSALISMHRFLSFCFLQDYTSDKRIKFTAAGKNFATFDKGFLEALPYWDRLFRIRHRVLDPANLFVSPLEDLKPPDFDTCMQRAGISGSCTHRALDDARDVCRLLRAGYRLPFTS